MVVDWTALVRRAVLQDQADQLARWRRAWDAYEGRFAPVLPAQPGRPRLESIPNLCKLVIDAKVHALFGQGVRVELAEGTETPEEEWLRSWWKREEVDLKLMSAALNGAITGHAFLRLTADRPFPRLIVLDSTSVQLQWEAEDIDRITGYVITWNDELPDGRPVTRRQRILAQNNNTWSVVDEVTELGSPSYRVIGQAPWPYPFPPVVDTQNLPAPNQVWGRPDLTDDLIDLNRAIGFALSNSLLIYRYHGHPRTVARNVPPTHPLRVGPDEVIYLASGQELEVLQPSADLANGLALARQLTELFFQTARIPEVAVGRLQGVGALSGVALRILYRPLMEDLEAKRRLYGRMVEQLVQRALVLAGWRTTADADVRLHWPEPIPANQEELARTALVWSQLGVSQRTILERLGFDWDLERQHRAEDEASLGEMVRRAMARPPETTVTDEPNGR